MQTARRVFPPFACFVFVAVLGDAAAQVRCTMPNGRVIEQQLSDQCPQGAVKSETFEGKPAPIVTTPIQRPVSPQPLAPATVQKPSSPKRESTSAVELAYGLCGLLKQTGAATSCEVDVNVFSLSFIDATVLDSPRSARQACLKFSESFRSGGSAPFREGAGWEMRLFSPYSGNRPIASCRL